MNVSGTTTRRAEIAMAARSLVAERGFEGLRTRDIAERVGINIATLHYHIPTKESLIELVAQSLRDDFIAQSEARPRAGLSPLQKIRLEFDDFRDTLVKNPELFVVLTELRIRARRDKKVAAAIGPMTAYWHRQWSEILSAGRNDGSLRPDLDPAAAATMVIGALMASERFSDDPAAHFDRVVAELERALTNPAAIYRSSP
ncbi:hypothetical protein MesoLjLc_59570 [Mesorhizobium sp. L-8-10]|uniref:TetR/AcrR family transcriptional regulator n=1 Tax=Mesorhizobium sp. L-8-10 TaxID=2744523 RepID=UPI001928CEDB|nr:TetR/AcrR family transcriptional regulator [Mesorhizobium sp. L-8-10]BCH34027.1 hypothetical protein MesoLjLc_59570 [Mesorhizobium sp. L-8-10]